MDGMEYQLLSKMSFGWMRRFWRQKSNHQKHGCMDGWMCVGFDRTNSGWEWTSTKNGCEKSIDQANVSRFYCWYGWVDSSKFPDNRNYKFFIELWNSVELTPGLATTSVECWWGVWAHRCHPWRPRPVHRTAAQWTNHANWSDEICCVVFGWTQVGFRPYSMPPVAEVELQNTRNIFMSEANTSQCQCQSTYQSETFSNDTKTVRQPLWYVRPIVPPRAALQSDWHRNSPVRVRAPKSSNYSVATVRLHLATAIDCWPISPSNPPIQWKSPLFPFCLQLSEICRSIGFVLFRANALIYIYYFISHHKCMKFVDFLDTFYFVTDRMLIFEILKQYQVVRWRPFLQMKEWKRNVRQFNGFNAIPSHTQLHMIQMYYSILYRFDCYILV